MNLIDLLDNLKQETLLKKEILQRTNIKRETLEKDLITLQHIEKKLEEETDINNKAIKFLKKLKIDKRDNDSNAITNALDSIIAQIFPRERLSFNIKSKLRGKNTYSRLECYKGSAKKVRLLKYCNGNGLRQVVSFTAVYTILSLSDKTPTLVLDECFRSISKAEAETMSEVLNHLSDLGFQLILIEHNESVFKQLEKYSTYVLEKVFDSNKEYTRIKEYTIGGIKTWQDQDIKTQ